MIISDAKTIHLKIYECIDKIIPKVSGKSVLELNNKLKTLMKYEKFIEIMKKYVETVSSSNKNMGIYFY